MKAPENMKSARSSLDVFRCPAVAVRWTTQRLRPGSAEWHSAVSQIVYLRGTAHVAGDLESSYALPNAIRRYNRLPVCVTASSGRGIRFQLRPSTELF
jgi:hypothetical protein